jgi:hypothetical protein
VVITLFIVSAFQWNVEEAYYSGLHDRFAGLVAVQRRFDLKAANGAFMLEHRRFSFSYGQDCMKDGFVKFEFG